MQKAKRKTEKCRPRRIDAPDFHRTDHKNYAMPFRRTLQIKRHLFWIAPRIYHRLFRNEKILSKIFEMKTFISNLHSHLIPGRNISDTITTELYVFVRNQGIEKNGLSGIRSDRHPHLCGACSAGTGQAVPLPGGLLQIQTCCRKTNTHERIIPIF